MCHPQKFETSSILYRNKQLAIPNSWGSKALSISLFETNESVVIDINNIEKSLLQMSEYIWNNKLKGCTELDIPALSGFG